MNIYIYICNLHSRKNNKVCVTKMYSCVRICICEGCRSVGFFAWAAIYQAKNNLTTRPHSLEHMVPGLRRWLRGQQQSCFIQDPSSFTTPKLDSSWLPVTSVPGSVRVSLTEKHHYQKQPGEEKVDFSAQLESSIKGSQGKDLKAGTGAEAKEEHCLLISLSYTG